MSVRDHTAKPRPPRVRWFLTVIVSFSAGTISAATLFAYSSRIPIPLKDTPTRGADDLLRKEPTRIEEQIEFPERLRTRQIGVVETEEPARTTREPVLPEPTGPAAGAEGEVAAARPAPEPVATTPEDLSFYILAGAYADSAAADGLAAELGGLDMQAEVRETAGGDGDKLYRVVIGPFDKAAAAESVRAQLALTGRSSTMMQLPAN